MAKTFPHPEPRPGHSVIPHKGETIFKITFKPQYILIHNTGKKKGKAREVFNSLKRAKSHVDYEKNKQGGTHETQNP